MTSTTTNTSLPNGLANDICVAIAANPGLLVEEVAEATGDPTGAGLARVQGVLPTLVSLGLIHSRSNAIERPHHSALTVRWYPGAKE